MATKSAAPKAKPAVKKAAPAKAKPAAAKPEKKVGAARVKPAPAKAKPVAAKVAGKVGTRYSCSVCGLIVAVDTACNCVDVCDLVCCSKPMKVTRK